MQTPSLPTEDADQLLQTYGHRVKPMAQATERAIQQASAEQLPDLLLLQAYLGYLDDQALNIIAAAERLLSLPYLSQAQRGRGLLALSLGQLQLGQQDRLATQLQQAAQALANGSPAQQRWFTAVGGMLYASVDRAEQAAPLLEAAYEQRQAYVREHGDNILAAIYLNSVGIGLEMLGQVQRSIEVQRELISLYQTQGYSPGLPASTYNLAYTYRRHQQPDLAMLMFINSKDQALQLNDQRHLAFTLRQLAEVSMELGEYTEALEYAQQALLQAEQHRVERLYISTRLTLAKALLEADAEGAAQLLDEAQQLTEQMQVQERYGAQIQALRERLL